MDGSKFPGSNQSWEYRFGSRLKGRTNLKQNVYLEKKKKSPTDRERKRVTNDKLKQKTTGVTANHKYFLEMTLL